MTNSLRFALVTALKATLDLRKELGIGSHPLVELSRLCDGLDIAIDDDDKNYFWDVITRNYNVTTN